MVRPDDSPYRCAALRRDDSLDALACLEIVVRWGDERRAVAQHLRPSVRV